MASDGGPQNREIETPHISKQLPYLKISSHMRIPPSGATRVLKARFKKLQTLKLKVDSSQQARVIKRNLLPRAHNQCHSRHVHIKAILNQQICTCSQYFDSFLDSKWWWIHGPRVQIHHIGGTHFTPSRASERTLITWYRFCPVCGTMKIIQLGSISNGVFMLKWCGVPT